MSAQRSERHNKVRLGMFTDQAKRKQTFLKAQADFSQRARSQPRGLCQPD